MFHERFVETLSENRQVNPNCKDKKVVDLLRTEQYLDSLVSSETLCQSLVSELSAAANTLDFVTSVERAVQVGDVASKGPKYFMANKNLVNLTSKFCQKNSQSGESFCLQVVTHSKKCSVYFIDKDSAEARWVGPAKKKNTCQHQHSSCLFLLPRFGPIPPNLCRSLLALPLVVGWESLSGHRGVTGGSPATGCYD